MSNILALLGKIEQKPRLYIGNASLTALRQFLVGYKFARQEMGILPIDEELDFYQNFQPWLQIRFHVQTVNSWEKIRFSRTYYAKILVKHSINQA
ncbi:hypothetical protein [Microseira sp. BLCC-F43]|jgi:hypothetical protein|uniref:hypothetical protein n=1 Tax=Microseira sp. BLCC-F43 TaxID=3153602 RepID=UPI0035B8AD58